MKKVVVILLLSMFILISPVAYLLSTTQGAVWVINKLSSSFDSKLNYKHIEGNLLQGLSLQSLDINNNRQDTWSKIQCDLCAFTWRPKSLLRGKLKISALTLKNLSVELNIKNDKTNKEAINIPDFSLPIAIDIDSLSVENLNVKIGEKKLF